MLIIPILALLINSGKQFLIPEHWLLFIALSFSILEYFVSWTIMHKYMVGPQHSRGYAICNNTYLPFLKGYIYSCLMVRIVVFCARKLWCYTKERLICACFFMWEKCTYNMKYLITYKIFSDFLKNELTYPAKFSLSSRLTYFSITIHTYKQFFFFSMPKLTKSLLMIDLALLIKLILAMAWLQLL